MLGGSELIWILLLVFLLFGSKKLPEFARGVGEAMREFKKAAQEAQHEPAPTETARRLETPAEEPAATSVKA